MELLTGARGLIFKYSFRVSWEFSWGIWTSGKLWGHMGGPLFVNCYLKIEMKLHEIEIPS